MFKFSPFLAAIASAGLLLGAQASFAAPATAPYEGSQLREMPTILDVTGKYGVKMGGGHFLTSADGKQETFPRETQVTTKQTVSIPAGAVVKYAFIYYGGVFGITDADGKDYTADKVGTGTQADGLNDINQVKGNGLTFKINGTSYTHDPYTRLPSGQSAIGSSAAISSDTFAPKYGTLTGTKTAFWSNRLDITGLMQNKSGDVSFEVSPPERLDPNVNSAAANGGNPAGSTLYNSCLGTANWSVVIVYEDASLPTKQIIVKDDIVRAWDYMYIHKGIWQRPQVKFSGHSPMQSGAKFYVVAQSGNYAGIAVNGAPTCGCGCGGTYYLKKTATSGSDKSSQYWSNTLVDPAVVANDFAHKDKTNGPWTLTQRTTFGSTVKRGNDWTLFQSGSKFTEFPNLYEGRNQAADTTDAVTAENDDATNDRFGHPWNGRGTVKYHGWGNDLTAVEVAPDAANLIPGSTETSFFFKGDQKDVFKPQERVMIRMLALEIPVGSQTTTTTAATTSTTAATTSTTAATTSTTAATTSTTAATTSTTAATTSTTAATTSTTKASTSTTAASTTTTTTTTTTLSAGTCYKTSNLNHVWAARAYDMLGTAYAYGSNQKMGADNLLVITKLRKKGFANYVIDPTCP